MNKLREQPQEQPKKIKKEKKQSKFARAFASLFSGSFLAEEATLRQLPFIFFLTFIALCYVANGYYSESAVRKINRVTNEIKELKSEYIITKSDLMFISKQSEVARAAARTGLKEAVTPPKKIIDTVTVKAN
ncbi:MAG: FtsL-like putative cell division protein [Bacteroidota bacterium]